MDTNPMVISPIWVFIWASCASGVAGVAAYLRSGKPVGWLALITALLNSGLLGLSIVLLWYRQFKDNPYSLIGLCVLTGLMGAAGLDFVISVVSKGGLTINLNDKKSEEIKSG